MRRDPVMVAKVEAAVTSKLAEIAPYLDKVSELEARERADTLTAQDAAAARAKGEQWDMTPWLVGFMGGMVLLVVGFFGAVAIMDMLKNGKVATEVWAALTGVSGTLLGILGTIYAYRFASTQQSATKNAIIGEIARSKTP
jgi:heme/copper-type cytochrome/quinol oxidase subunit 3